LSFDYKEVLIMPSTLSLVSEMIRIASELDDRGFAREADQVEKIVKTHLPRFLKDIKPQELPYRITPRPSDGTFTRIKISAKSKEELDEAVEEYFKKYNPWGYGTKLIDPVKDEEGNFFQDEEGNFLDEEGNFFVIIRRSPSAD